MQEDIERRTIAISVQATKLTGQTLAKALQAVLRRIEEMLNGVLIDPANYTSESGSTVVTLKPEYLKTLTVGEHRIEFLFTDGSVKTNLTILAADVIAQADPTPGTGDNSNTILWLLLGGVSFILTCGTIAGRKKYKAVKK